MAPNCPAAKASLVIQDMKIAFSPGEGTWILSGELQGTHVQAERSRPGADRKLYQTTLNASVQGSTLTGVYKTPTCTYDVKLQRY